MYLHNKQYVLITNVTTVDNLNFPYTFYKVIFLECDIYVDIYIP